jgi:hypothetical protein
MVLRSKLKNCRGDFKAQNHETITVGFEDQTEKPEPPVLRPKPGETVAISFEAKPKKTVPVILRSNH